MTSVGAAAEERDYFAEFRRGEVEELRGALQTAGLARDEGRAREAMARVVGYMGLGADVSALFLEVVRAAGQALDPTLKRLCHLYLCRYARTHPDLALLAVNTLRRDCAHNSPAVRGMALRALAGLRLPALAEHLAPPALAAAADPAPYVRRAAALSLAKLARVHPAMLARLRAPHHARLLLRDRDPQTALNALVALSALRFHIAAVVPSTAAAAAAAPDDTHLSAEELDECAEDLAPDFPGHLRSLTHLQQQQRRLGIYGVDVLSEALSPVACDDAVALSLLSRLHELTEWSQCLLLEALSAYRPPPDQLLALLNLLDSRLASANLGVLLGAARLFLTAAELQPALLPRVCARLAVPLLTHLETGTHEQAFAALCHLALLARRQPSLFAARHRHFYCRHNEPAYLRLRKLATLPLLACPDNGSALLAELAEYAFDPAPVLAAAAVSSLAQVAARLPALAVPAADHLLSFLHLRHPPLAAAALSAAASLVRRYPPLARAVLPELPLALATLTPPAAFPKARAAAAWLLGQHGHNLRDGPYLLDALVRRYVHEPAPVRLQLLTACVKQLFCRPPEMRPVLSALLRSALADTLHVHVHDRALFYYRLLAADPAKARVILTSTHADLGAHALLPLHEPFPEEPSAELTEQIFDQFNSLTVLYDQPADDLLLSSRPLNSAEQAALDEEEDEDDEYFYDYEDEETVAVAAPAPAPVALPQTTTVAETTSPTVLNLRAKPHTTPALFQEQWTQLAESGNMAVRFTSTPVANLIESKLRERGIVTIASGR
jgi:vesicle coat complex subunit